MTDKELVGIVLFAKRKFYFNNQHIQHFLNQTQDLRTKVTYDTNYQHGKDALESTLFFIIDPEDNTMGRQLANFAGATDDMLPAIYAIRFRNNKDSLEKLRFKHIERYNSRMLLEFIQTMYYDNVMKTFDWREYHEEKNQYNTNVMLLNSFSHDKLLSVNHKERLVAVIEYTTRFCRECLKLKAVVDKLSKKVTTINGYKVIYGRVDIYENDFVKLPVEEVPLLRVYKLDGNGRKHIDIKEVSEEGIILSLKKFVYPVDGEL